MSECIFLQQTIEKENVGDNTESVSEEDCQTFKAEEVNEGVVTTTGKSLNFRKGKKE